MSHILPEWTGYVVVIGFGGIFALLTTAISKLNQMFGNNNSKQTSENFNTANRSVKTGLIAAVIVSQWTWAATLLQSSTVAYRYGISGPFWYAAGATVQVILFSLLAIQVKRIAPNAHTFCEIIRARYGNTAHKIYLFFGLLTNCIVTAMLLFGGSAVVSELTGMPVIAAALLIPVSVVTYTHHGGLVASFISAYTHTTIIYAMLIVFSLSVYAFSDKLGSPSVVWNLLNEASTKNPVEGNEEGSYLTMSSTGGLIFGMINIVGNFGTIFCDQAYWQSAIASQPQSSVKGFILGGLCWFCIPFTLATSVGLSSVALGIKLTEEQVESGLVVPLTVELLMGKAGALAVLAILFLAITSAGSAELIAVSSLFTYDIYWTYINPKATGDQLLKISKYFVLTFGVFMSLMAIGLMSLGLNLGYVYLAMGIMIGSGVVPVALTLLWKKTNAIAFMIAPIIGLVCGVSSWFVSAFLMYDELSLKSTGHDVPLLIGNLTSLGVGAFVVVVGSFLKPANFDFQATKNLKQLDEKEESQNTSNKSEREQTIDGEDNQNVKTNQNEDDDARLLSALKFSIRVGLILTVLLCIAWPLPLLISKYVFSETIFTGWIIFSILWACVAACIIVFMPLIESRNAFLLVFYGIRDRFRAHLPYTIGEIMNVIWGLCCGLIFPFISLGISHWISRNMWFMFGSIFGTAVNVICIGFIVLFAFESENLELSSILITKVGFWISLFGLIFGLILIGIWVHKYFKMKQQTKNNELNPLRAEEN